jgi:chitin synthase
MLDVGTKPDRTAIWKLYDAMERDRHIGGCCGEIKTLSPVNVNPFIAAQHFEYKISTVLDKG